MTDAQTQQATNLKYDEQQNKKFMKDQEKDVEKHKKKESGTEEEEGSTQKERKPKQIPGEVQKTHPGSEHKMKVKPRYMAPNYKGSEKLKDKIAVVTGGDSGIGRSVCILFAREGARIGLLYYHEDKDAQKTKSMIEKEGSECVLIKGDISDPKFCNNAIQKVVDKFGRIDILVNNAAQQYKGINIEELPNDQMERTFRVNIFSMFYLTKACLPHMKKGSSIINTTSVTAYKGKEILLDYSTTKGAINAFTYSLSQQLADRGIRVNGVAPGPIWTPLIPSSFSEEDVENFGKNSTLGRPGQPEEVAPCYVFLASEADSSYMTGQILHPNGGEIVHG